MLQIGLTLSEVDDAPAHRNDWLLEIHRVHTKVSNARQTGSPPAGLHTVPLPPPGGPDA